MAIEYPMFLISASGLLAVISSPKEHARVLDEISSLVYAQQPPWHVGQAFYPGFGDRHAFRGLEAPVRVPRCGHEMQGHAGLQHGASLAAQAEGVLGCGRASMRKAAVFRQDRRYCATALRSVAVPSASLRLAHVIGSS